MCHCSASSVLGCRRRVRYHAGVESGIRKTRKAWDEPGHAHFLTYSCYRRVPLLSRDRARRWVIDAMQSARREHDAALWAYVIKPEHVHLLLCPRRPRYEMRRILAALKRPVATAAKAYVRERGEAAWLDRLTVRYPTREVFRFWQPGGGFDHNSFEEKTVAAVLEYIYANPVRRRLVAHPADWEWSSAWFWEGRRDVPLAMDHPDG
ncbi:Transposase IS200 like protein [Phycisphaerae bacterium RAS1]|nr:Transposase IS200 like protein [Phycisphaerae bacterium RAS1]